VSFQFELGHLAEVDPCHVRRSLPRKPLLDLPLPNTLHLAIVTLPGRRADHKFIRLRLHPVYLGLRGEGPLQLLRRYEGIAVRAGTELVSLVSSCLQVIRVFAHLG